jgi:hypothetical protein
MGTYRLSRARERWKQYEIFQSDILKENDNVEDLDVDGKINSKLPMNK